MGMRLDWREDNRETNACDTGGGVVRVQREIKVEAGQRQTRLPYKLFLAIMEPVGTTGGFRESGESGVCARDRLEQRPAGVRLFRFIQVSYLGEQRECNSTQHVISQGV